MQPEHNCRKALGSVLCQNCSLLAKASGTDSYLLERRLGHQSQPYFQRYTNPHEAAPSLYLLDSARKRSSVDRRRSARVQNGKLGLLNQFLKTLAIEGQFWLVNPDIAVFSFNRAGYAAAMAFGLFLVIAFVTLIHWRASKL